MENQKEIRWKQRFQNFEKAFQLLERTVQIKNKSEAERGGLIQFYEVAFELSWKIMKDYFEAEGFNPKSPRASIKQAVQNEIIENGHVWIDALDDRNTTTHAYDEKAVFEISNRITEIYYPEIKQLYLFFKYENDKK